VVFESIFESRTRERIVKGKDRVVSLTKTRDSKERIISKKETSNKNKDVRDRNRNDRY
jgi:hypothetical protein